MTNDEREALLARLRRKRPEPMTEEEETAFDAGAAAGVDAVRAVEFTCAVHVHADGTAALVKPDGSAHVARGLVLPSWLLKVIEPNRLARLDGRSNLWGR